MLPESAAMPPRKGLKLFQNDFKTVDFLSTFLRIDDHPAWLDGEWFDSGLIFLPFVLLWPFLGWLYHQCLNDYLGLKPRGVTTNAKQWFGKRETRWFASRSIFFVPSIIFCFTDLSLNNSCWAGAKEAHCREDEAKWERKKRKAP